MLRSFRKPSLKPRKRLIRKRVFKYGQIRRIDRHRPVMMHETQKEVTQKEETDIIQLLFYDDCFHVTHLFSMFSDKDNKKGYSYFNKDELKNVQFNLFFYDDWVNGRYLDVDVDGEKVLLDKDNYVRAEDLPQPWLDNFQMIFNELGDGKPINSVLEEFVPGSLEKFLLKTKTLKGLS